jgi:hypothetical protein
MKEKDAYLKIVEWSEEDQCYIGSVPGWVGKCCHGSHELKVYEELCEIVSLPQPTRDILENLCSE